MAWSTHVQPWTYRDSKLLFSEVFVVEPCRRRGWITAFDHVFIYTHRAICGDSANVHLSMSFFSPVLPFRDFDLDLDSSRVHYVDTLGHTPTPFVSVQELPPLLLVHFLRIFADCALPIRSFPCRNLVVSPNVILILDTSFVAFLVIIFNLALFTDNVAVLGRLWVRVPLKSSGQHDARLRADDDDHHADYCALWCKCPVRCYEHFIIWY